MKNKRKLIILPIVLLILAGCSQSVERADRTITLIQDNMTSIINLISEIQFNEQGLQGQFEEMINSEQELQAFQNEEAGIFVNIDQRNEYLTQLEENRTSLVGLREEIQAQSESDGLPSDQVTQVDQNLEQLIGHLETYINDYRTNLEVEQQLYQSLANPNLDYTQFFGLFDQISVITTNNQMNLEKVIEYVEPINTILINLKVYLANLQEAS